MSAFSLGLSLPIASFGAAVLSPPTVAPVLTVSTSFESYTANLEWTASDKLGSAGFGYRLELSINDQDFNEIVSLSSEHVSYNDYRGDAANTLYAYRITPFNNAGDGPASNTTTVVLPGE